MKKVRQYFWTFLRCMLGILILAVIFRRVDNSSHYVGFTVKNSSAEAGAVYFDASDTSRVFIVATAADSSDGIETLLKQGKPSSIPASGVLTLGFGAGDREIEWFAFAARPAGLRMMKTILADSGRRWPWYAAGFLLCVLVTAGTMLRWRIVLRTLGICLPFRKISSLVLVGAFFNSFLPGATGGDLVKAYYAAREVRTDRTTAVASVFLERLIGMPALLLFAGSLMLLKLDLFLSDPFARFALAFVGLLAFLTVAGLSVVLARHIFEQWRLFRMLETRTAIGPTLRKAYDAMFVLRRNPGAVARAFLLSIALQAAVIASGFCYARGIGEDVAAADFFPLFSSTLIISAIPVTPGGLGIRETATVFLLQSAGIGPANALLLSLLFYISTVMIGIPGGIVFMSGSWRQKPAPAGEDSGPGRP